MQPVPIHLAGIIAPVARASLAMVLTARVSPGFLACTKPIEPFIQSVQKVVLLFEMITMNS